MIHEKITMMTSKVFVGDVYYVLDHVLSDNDGVIYAKDSDKIIAVTGHTDFGDGTFYDEHHNEFWVDTAGIGVTDLAYLSAKKPCLEGGLVVDIPSGVAIVDFLCDKHGRFTITIYDKEESANHILYTGEIIT